MNLSNLIQSLKPRTFKEYAIYALGSILVAAIASLWQKTTNLTTQHAELKLSLSNLQTGATNAINATEGKAIAAANVLHERINSLTSSMEKKIAASSVALTTESTTASMTPDTLTGLTPPIPTSGTIQTADATPPSPSSPRIR